MHLTYIHLITSQFIPSRYQENNFYNSYTIFSYSLVLARSSIGMKQIYFIIDPEAKNLILLWLNSGIGLIFMKNIRTERKNESLMSKQFLVALFS